MREAIQNWLRDTMAARGWSAEQWARHAKLSPTTITRFLNASTVTWVLSSRTVTKLAEAAQVPPPYLVPTDGRETRALPLYAAFPGLVGWPNMKAESTLVVHETAAADAFAVVLTVDPKERGELRRGDVLIVEPLDENDELEDGDLVIAEVAGEVAVFKKLLESAFLSLTEAPGVGVGARREDMRLIGRVVSLQRRLRPLP